MQGLPPAQPNPNMLRQLLVRDSEARGLPYVPRDDNIVSGGMQDVGGSLQTMDNSRLIAAMNRARGSGDMESMRGLRNIIEGRSSNDIARGPKGAGQGLTSAEPIQPPQIQNPFKILSDAMREANQGQY